MSQRETHRDTEQRDRDGDRDGDVVEKKEMGTVHRMASNKVRIQQYAAGDSGGGPIHRLKPRAIVGQTGPCLTPLLAVTSRVSSPFRTWPP